MKRNVQIALMFLSIVLVGNIHAQKAKVDSLENLLKSLKLEDTVKVNLLNEIANQVTYNDIVKSRKYATEASELADQLKFLKGKVESLWLIGLSYARSDSEKAIEYYQAALKIAEDIDYKIGIIKCLNAIGITYGSNADDIKAIECSKKALKIAEGLNNKLEMAKCISNISRYNGHLGNYDEAIVGYKKALELLAEQNDKLQKASITHNLGVIFNNQGNYPLALEHYQKAFKIYEELENKLGCFVDIHGIGNIYLMQSDFANALEYSQKSLKIAEELNDKVRISAALRLIGNTYLAMKDPQALEYFQKALKISDELNNIPSTISTLISMGDFYRQSGNYEKALDCLQNARGKSKKNGAKNTLCIELYSIGNIYLQRKEFVSALDYTLKSLDLAIELQLLDTQKDIRNQLSEIYAATNDYKNAYINHKLYKALNDSIFNEKNIKRITGLEYTYKFEKEKQAIVLEQQKKDAIQVAEKKQQQIIMFSFIGGFILMFLLAIVAFRSRQLKQRTNIILTQQKHEIEEKNEELLQLNEEVLAQRDEILAQKTEIETNNIKLQELNDTKDKFFGIIAHDLKNPFNAILGFSNLLVSSDNEYDQKTTMECVGMIHSSAQSAYKLLENLLEWSKSQTGSIDYKPQVLVLKDLVIESKNLCENLAKAKNISIRCDLQEDLMISADPNMLNTILRNLITNAIKFTHKDGSISITSMVNNGTNEITISDTGIGMDEETKNKLFKINEKISIRGTEDEKGTGLGLLLCKEFVERHGGEIWAESELGKGSEFKFTMPLGS